MNSRTMVIGGSGFTGGFVIRRLVELGHEVTALTRSAAAVQRVTALGAKAVEGDLDDPEALRAALTEADAERLVTVASLGFGHAPSLVLAAERQGFERCVFVSTTGIFTRLPAASKAVRLKAEKAITGSRLSFSILRPTMIYGAPGDRNMERLIAHLRWFPVIPAPGGGRHLQQPVHVEDLAATIVAAALEPTAHRRVFDVPGPEPLAFREIIHATGAALGRRTIVVPVPVRPLRWAVAQQERLLPSPRLKVEQIERLVEDKVFDASAAARYLGHRPRSFPEGIAGEVRALESEGSTGAA